MNEIALRPTPSLNRDRTRGFAYLFIGAAFLVCLAFVPLGIQQNRADLIYVSVATIAFILPALVAISRPKFDVFEPISLLALAILFGSTLRSFYLVLSDNSRADFLMMGTNFEAVLNNSGLILFGVVSFCAGYLFVGSRIKFRVSRSYQISPSYLAFVSLVILGLSLVGLFFLIESNGIDLGNILGESMKRSSQFVTDEGEVVYGAGWVLFLTRSAQYAFLLLAAGALVGLVPRRPFWLGLILVSAGIAMMGPFLSSSRSAIIVMFINLACFAYYYSKLSMRTVVIAALAAVSLVLFMGELRSVNQTGMSRYDGVFDAVLGSGNSIDFVRTSAIIDKVPSAHDYLYGESYLSLFTAFVPRDFWPNKPNPSLGPWVKSELFGQAAQNNGWPPGMIAEAYINFGIAGIGTVLAIFGVALRCVYESAKPYLGVSFPITLLYACGIWRLAFGTIGLNFAQGILQALQYLVPMAIVLFLVRSRRSHAHPA